MKEYPPTLEHGIKTFYLGTGRGKKKSSNHSNVGNFFQKVNKI